MTSVIFKEGTGISDQRLKTLLNRSNVYRKIDLCIKGWFGSKEICKLLNSERNDQC